MVSYLWSMEGAAQVMPLSRNSCVFHVYVCVWVSVAEEGECATYQILSPACVHIHVECVGVLLCALSLWNELLMHNSVHARMIGMPVTLEQTGLPLEWLCHSLGRQLPCCHWGGPASIPGQFMYSQWWTKWQWDRFLSEYFDCPLSVSCYQYLCIHLSLMLYNCSPWLLLNNTHTSFGHRVVGLFHWEKWYVTSVSWKFL
jgi:hypothetical protein